MTGQGDPPAGRRCVTLVGVLGSLRDYSTGKPKARVRLLAVVVALLLAGPLTIVVLRLAGALLDLLV